MHAKPSHRSLLNRPPEGKYGSHRVEGEVFLGKRVAFWFALEDERKSDESEVYERESLSDESGSENDKRKSDGIGYYMGESVRDENGSDESESEFDERP